jgi:hypothetical protein
MSNILTNNINPRSGNLITIGGSNDKVSIAGTLTYEDVSNIDSVGIITAQSGLQVTGGNMTVGGTTVTDSNLLNIQGTSATSNIGVVLNDTNTSKIYGIQNGASALKVFDYTASAERMQIDSSGRVVIGVAGFSDDRERLVIKSPTGNGTFLTIEAPSDTGTSQLFFGDSDFNVGRLMYDHNDDSMSFFTNDAERMRITSGGNLGINHSTPQFGITLGQDAGDIGKIGWEDAGNSKRASITCSTSSDALQFHTGTSDTERMRIDSSGRVLIGTTSASNSSVPGVKIIGGSAATVDVVTNRSDNLNVNHIYNTNATRNGYRYYVSLDGGIRNFSGSNVNLSDEREKKNIVDMDSTWSELKQWTLRQFHFNDQDNSEDKCYGVIAQQIETVSPQVLSTFDTNSTTTRKGVKEQKMMWMAIKALQEAMAKIETLEQRLTDAGL